MADYTLSASITGDSSSFERACAAASSAVSSFDKKTSGIGSTISAMGNEITKVGNKLTSCITKPAITAGAALGTVVLAKGWARMTEIDDAKAKLVALGYSTEDVSKIMSNANDAVTGTSYNLAEAATTAASAVAAGIQPGKDLSQYLGSVADTAAIAGTSMSDMGSIFNQVATNGKATNRVLQELANAGIPIYQYLADQCGVTEDAIFNMASNGEISLEMFRKAIEDNLNGAAEVIGSSTISGALSNIGASISRIGQNFLGSADDANTFAGQILPLLNDFKDKLGTVEDKAKEWGAIFGEVFSGIVDYVKTGGESFDQLSDKAQGIVSKITPIIDVVKKIGTAFSDMSTTSQVALVTGTVAAGPLISTFGKVVSAIGSAQTTVSQIGEKFSGLGTTVGSLSSSTGILSGALGGLSVPIGAVIGVVAALAAAFIYLMGSNDDFRSSIMDSVSSIGSSLQPVLQTLGTCLSNLAGAVFPALANVAQSLAPLFTTIASCIASVVSVVAPLVQMIIGTVIPMISTLLSGIINFIAMALTPVIAAVDAILSALQPILDCIGMILEALASGEVSISQILEIIIQAVVNFASNFVQFLVNAATEAVNGVVTFFSELPGKIQNFLSNIITRAIAWGSNLINNMRTAASNAITAVANFFSQLPGKIQTFLQNVISRVISWGSQLLSNMKSAATKAIQGAVTLFQQLPTKIKTAIDKVFSKISQWGSQVLSAFKSAIQSVINSAANWGRDIVNKIASGISNAIGKVKSAASSVASAVKNVLHFSTPDEGPLVDADTYMPDFMALLAKGIEDNKGLVVNQVKSLANEIEKAATIGTITTDVVANESGLSALSAVPQQVEYSVKTVDARSNMEPIDMTTMLEGMVIQIYNETNVDGTPLKEQAAEYTIKKIGNQQRAVLRARGA